MANSWEVTRVTEYDTLYKAHGRVVNHFAYTNLTEQKRIVCFGLLFVLTGSNLVQTGLEFSLQ